MPCRLAAPLLRRLITIEDQCHEILRILLRKRKMIIGQQLNPLDQLIILVNDISPNGKY